MRLRCRAPATVATLGPGFDSLAMAIDLWNEVIIETEAPPAVEVRGEGAGELPEDGSNLIFRSMTYLSREVGKPLPSFRLSSVNRIPLERGLGSSSAAVVSGLLIADRLLEARLGEDGILQMAADLEGHPDNAAAGLWGGVVVAYLSPDGWSPATGFAPRSSSRWTSGSRPRTLGGSSLGRSRWPTRRSTPAGLH